MHSRKKGLSAACCLLLAAVSLARADDWPQWLGPQRDSVWRESGILKSFPNGGPPIRWRTPVGPGFSGPSIANGKVYITDRQLPAGVVTGGNPFERTNSPGIERVLCLDEKDGHVLWKHQYECVYTVSYPAGPRVAPLIDGGKVYSLGAEGNLFCLNAADGKPVWSRDFGVKSPVWGFAGHPLVDGNQLICLVAGAGTTVVAFDKENGKELWRALSSGEPGYSSPMICEALGKRQLVIFHADAANGLNPRTGELYWSVPFKSQAGLSVATPRKMDDLLFFTSFYNGSLMLRLNPQKPDATVAWKTAKTSEKDTEHLNAIIPTPFLEAGYIYGICSYGQLRCLKADTGERVWETLKATTSGEPVRWGNAFLVKHEDRFFIFNEKGDLIIARLSPVGYEEISRTHLLDPTNGDPGRKVVWSHPGFANHCVYARNDKEIICADLHE
jgi:outer membrane protein assembly factor BamB